MSYHKQPSSNDELNGFPEQYLKLVGKVLKSECTCIVYSSNLIFRHVKQQTFYCVDGQNYKIREFL